LKEQNKVQKSYTYCDCN